MPEGEVTFSSTSPNARVWLTKPPKYESTFITSSPSSTRSQESTSTSSSMTEGAGLMGLGVDGHPIRGVVRTAGREQREHQRRDE